MKTIIIQGHTRDSFFMQDNNGRTYDGYVPDCFGEGGDDIVLEIDIETGKIIGWNKEKVKKELNKKFKEQE